MKDNVTDDVEKEVTEKVEEGSKKTAKKKAVKVEAGAGPEGNVQAEAKEEGSPEQGAEAEDGALAEAAVEVESDTVTGAADQDSGDVDTAEPAAAEQGVVEEEVPGERVPPKQWFVVHTYSGHENKVKTNLERAISSQGMQEKFGQVLVATEDFAEMKNGKRTVTKKKTFPSYVLIEMDMSNETRHLVTNIPGVTGFVGTGKEPLPLKDDEIKRVLGLDAEGKVAKPTPSVPFRIGEHVRVIDGPFSDFTGVVDEINSERGKVKVMVSIFGRATPVELDFLQVQSI